MNENERRNEIKKTVCVLEISQFKYPHIGNPTGPYNLFDSRGNTHIHARTRIHSHERVSSSLNFYLFLLLPNIIVCTQLVFLSLSRFHIISSSQLVNEQSIILFMVAPKNGNRSFYMGGWLCTVNSLQFCAFIYLFVVFLFLAVARRLSKYANHEMHLHDGNSDQSYCSLLIFVFVKKIHFFYTIFNFFWTALNVKTAIRGVFFNSRIYLIALTVYRYDW